MILTRCCSAWVACRPGAPERHDAVTGVLIDRAFETVHAFAQDREGALENVMPLVRIELLGEQAAEAGQSWRVDLKPARIGPCDPPKHSRWANLRRR